MSDTTDSDILVNLVGEISYLISVGNCVEALKCIRDPTNVQTLKTNVWDLIPRVSNFLTPVASIELQDCCTEILQEIAYISQPEEVILEFIEQAECSENNQVKFKIFLKLLKICLYKLPIGMQTGISLTWCLNTIQGHVVTLSLLTDDEEEQKTYVSCDEIIDVYKSIIEFYKSFLYDDIPPFSLAQDGEGAPQQRKSLVCFLLHLLGKPLMHMDLESCDTKSRAREIAEELLVDLSTLVNDIFMFLRYVELREMHCRSKYKKKLTTEVDNDDDNVPSDDYLREDEIPTLSLGVLYYLVLGERIELDHVPHVYNPLYILQTSLYLVAVMLKKPEENGIIRKGLLLASGLTSRLADLTVPFGYLDSSVHKEFAEALSVIAVYSESLESRRLAIKVLKEYIFKFDMKGRYYVMSNFILLIDHSSLFGYLTMLLKDMIVTAMNCRPISIHFSGQSLIGLLKEFVKLPQGDMCDLADNRDRVLAALNLLYSIFTTDTENITGIWNSVEIIEELCLKPLDKAIDISRKHYRLQLSDLTDGKKTKETGLDGAELSVTIVGKGRIDPFEDPVKAEVLQFALNGFDLMENLLVLLKKRIESRL